MTLPIPTPRKKLREIIAAYETGGIAPSISDLQEVERGLLLIVGYAEGSTESLNQSYEEIGTYTAGELIATKKHLDDMRRLVLMENEKGDVD